MNGKGMQTMRTSEEMFRLILDVAREDDRIRAVVLSGSRADPEVPRDRYQDYDILFLVREVAPFYNNTAWIETTFGRPGRHADAGGYDPSAAAAGRGWAFHLSDAV